MGCVNSTPEEREAQRKSSAIDRQLRTDAKDFENTIKILLLGKSFVCEIICSIKPRHGQPSFS